MAHPVFKTGGARQTALEGSTPSPFRMSPRGRAQRACDRSLPGSYRLTGRTQPVKPGTACGGARRRGSETRGRVGARRRERHVGAQLVHAANAGGIWPPNGARSCVVTRPVEQQRDLTDRHAGDDGAEAAGHAPKRVAVRPTAHGSVAGSAVPLVRRPGSLPAGAPGPRVGPPDVGGAAPPGLAPAVTPGAVQPGQSMAFVSSATAPLRASARPTSAARAFIVIECSAKMSPTSAASGPSVAELASRQKTGCRPARRRSAEHGCWTPS